MRIAVLDDDPAQLAHLVHTLTHQLVMGDDLVSCAPFAQGEALRRALRRETFDLLVLDWNVPDLDGVELLSWLRRHQKSQVPVVMLSSRASERDVAGALGVGADDYVVKPFRPMELCARIRRLLARRRPEPNGDIETFGDWTFERATLSATFRPDRLESQAPSERYVLTDREFRFALALFRNMGKAVSRSYLLENAGYSGEETATRLLDSHIYRLRNKLGLHSGRRLRLQTIYGQGYRLQVSEPDASPAVPDVLASPDRAA